VCECVCVCACVCVVMALHAFPSGDSCLMCVCVRDTGRRGGRGEFGGGACVCVRACV